MKNGHKGASFRVEVVPIADLRAHPRNYRGHPADQIEHLVESLKRFGVYKNIVVARDGTVLAGHGLVEAAKKSKMERIPVVRLDVAPDSAAAIKVLVGDNEIEHLAEQNDRLLSELLKELKSKDKLLGTGFDDKMLANFVMVTRPANEIADFDEAAHWVGMPEFDSGSKRLFVVVNFRNKRDVKKFAKKLGVELNGDGTGGGRANSIWFPPREKQDLESVKFKT